ncbi:hypothetical protein CPB84DRAFT_1791215, partial [Gymnopilus junonius]
MSVLQIAVGFLYSLHCSCLFTGSRLVNNTSRRLLPRIRDRNSTATVQWATGSGEYSPQKNNNLTLFFATILSPIIILIRISLRLSESST